MPRYYNGGTVPLIPEGRWGEGVIMPGEPYDTDSELGPPWTLDTETTEATQAHAASQLEDLQANAMEAHAHESVQPNGDVVNEAGQIVGHVEPNQEAS